MQQYKENTCLKEHEQLLHSEQLEALQKILVLNHVDDAVVVHQKDNDWLPSDKTTGFLSIISPVFPMNTFVFLRLSIVDELKNSNDSWEYKNYPVLPSKVTKNELQSKFGTMLELLTISDPIFQLKCMHKKPPKKKTELISPA